MALVVCVMNPGIVMILWCWWVLELLRRSCLQIWMLLILLGILIELKSQSLVGIMIPLVSTSFSKNFTIYTKNERSGVVLVFMTGWDDINSLKEPCGNITNYLVANGLKA
ncbi:hypothetical protein Droror1_Dr00024186 [Drosera rotundifolia]